MASDRERGAAAIEFALVLPLLIVLVFGIVEFSIAYNHKQGLHAAAREGARLASLPTSTQADIQDRVNSALQGVISGTPTITISVAGDSTVDPPCQDHIGDTVVVTVSAPFDLDIPLWGSEALTLTGKGEFRCE
jgi:Flp pilus assembly protein TadG